MIILGIETSCDETAAAVLQADKKKGAKILSSVVSSQIKTHAKTGGVVPEVAARMHIENILPVIDAALKKAGKKLHNIQAIAVTSGPGLITSLMVGVDTAKTLASALNIPLIAVNHVEAHACSPLIDKLGTKNQELKNFFPAVALVVSGGHTDLILMQGVLRQKKIGQTVDDAAGECFDKTAKILNLGYPGGPLIAKLAKDGTPNIDFPRPMIASGDFNFSFSGLKTAVLYYVTGQRLNVKGQRLKADIAASVQQAIVDVLVIKTIAAAKKYRAKTILLGGGVAANGSLRERLKIESKKLNVNLLIAKPEHCTDNADIIAFCGWLHARKKDFISPFKIQAQSGWEIR